MHEPSDTGKEVEWQLDAQDLRLVLRWIENHNAAGPDGVTFATGATLRHVDTYFDTQDRRLDRADYSVRLRRAPRRLPEATLKSLDGAAPDALRIRRELTERLERDDVEALEQAPGPVGTRLRALAGRRGLVALFDVRTRRRVFPLSAAGVPSGELLLDETTIREPAGRILSRLRRVEIEVPEAAVGVLRPLVENLQRSCGLHPAVMSKYEVALAAIGRGRAETDEFGPTAIEPGDTIGQVALAVLRRQFAVLWAKEPGTRIGDDIEELHDMRVASRRLRAAIALFADVLPVEASRLLPDLAWIGRTVGAVRDVDVQLSQLDKWVTALPEPDREPLARLRALLEEDRERARAEMLEALDSSRYQTFIRRFGAMLRSRTGSRAAQAREVAPALLDRRRRGLRKAMQRVRRDPEPADFHRLRIAGKRFRYALEFLSNVYPGETGRLVRRTVALQDLLGAYQDAQVAVERLRSLASERATDLGPEAVFAMGEIAERYRRRFEEIPAEVPRAYSRLSGDTWKRFRKRLEAMRPPQA